jgi:hypothetical protein
MTFFAETTACKKKTNLFTDWPGMLSYIGLRKKIRVGTWSCGQRGALACRRSQVQAPLVVVILIFVIEN